MNQVEQSLRHLKSEADEILFEDLYFDSRLKKRVLRQVDKERERFTLAQWFHHRRFLWLYGTAVAASIAAFLIVFSPMLHDRAPKPVPGNTPLMATGEPGVNQPANTWLYTTPEEAKASFGEGLLIPSYTPVRVALSGIQASGDRQESATKVVLSYVYGEISFMVIEEKDTSAIGLHHSKSVDINGMPGYLNTGSETELQWITNGVHYTVIGHISETEAMKVAKSMK